MSRQRAWFLSPSIATAVFFVAQAVASFSSNEASSTIAAAAADAPNAAPVEVRVVAEIHALEHVTQAARAVPATEEALFEMIERDGAVIFDSEEVDVVAIPEQEFGSDEALVIRARARLVDPR
ncbi:MAG: hypothetical protein RIT81_06495 [Deltaproteobacteria bacterium]